jgi:Protein of unknown function (DUF2933)
MGNMRTHDPTPPFWRSRFGLGWLAMAAIAGWFLWTEHRAHLLGALPYLVLLACPLLHMFMHRGHHAHHGHDAHSERADATDRSTSKSSQVPP